MAGRRGGEASTGPSVIGSAMSTGPDDPIRPSPAIWNQEADIPDDVYFRALEAMGEAGP